MFSEDEDVKCTYRHESPDEMKVANTANNHVLPSLSRDKYNKVYDEFQRWKTLKGQTTLSQEVLMEYFLDMAEKSKPSTLWVTFSMLKATIRINDDVDINSYTELMDFLKRKQTGYVPNRPKIFSEEEIEKFVYEAPDEDWLDVKVVCIFGVSGVDSSVKLLNIKHEYIKQYEDLILVTIPKTETNVKRSFTITGTFFSIVEKYLALRPPNIKDDRFFVHYQQGRCTIQPIGKNKLYAMPRRIANFLKLPEPERYSIPSFRRPSATIETNTCAWKTTCATEQQNYSLDYKTGLMRSSTSYAIPPVSAASNMNDTMTDHQCTLSCGQAKCATEENEKSVAHAFSVMKPSDYTITDVTPTLFGSDPTCRWIVAYTHISEPVDFFNSEETFEDITRSIPNNVRVIQKYIRKNSSQMPAAYIVVYGVNCRCQIQNSDPLSTPSSDVFRFSVNKFEY